MLNTFTLPRKISAKAAGHIFNPSFKNNFDVDIVAFSLVSGTEPLVVVREKNSGGVMHNVPLKYIFSEVRPFLNTRQIEYGQCNIPKFWVIKKVMIASVEFKTII